MPTVGCPAKASSAPGVKMRIAALARVVDEHGLGEAELGGDGLPPRLRHGWAVQHDAQRVAPAAVGAHEHAQDAHLGHRPPPAAA